MRSSELDCAKLELSELDRAQPNQGPHCQIIMWNLRSSEISRSTEC